jgi:hypothetical protein
MMWFGTNKERERYYLLAGMGGLPQRRRQRLQLAWAVVVGLTVSLAIATLEFWLHAQGISNGQR